jgi:hypothetical protein
MEARRAAEAEALRRLKGLDGEQSQRNLQQSARWVGLAGCGRGMAWEASWVVR